MKRKQIYIPLIVIIIGFLIAFSLIINNTIILSRIYYKINSTGDILNFESLIEKSEIFEYRKYCLSRDYLGKVHNLSDVGYIYYIDEEFIDSLKLQIDEDKTKFHLYPFFSHNFVYSSDVTNESLIYLTYKSNSIIKAEYANHTEIFTARSGLYDNGSLYWIGSWYLNFTVIPFIPNISSNIALNDTLLVKLDLTYHHDYRFGGTQDLMLETYLGFNSNFQVLFVYMPFNPLVVE